MPPSGSGGSSVHVTTLPLRPLRPYPAAKFLSFLPLPSVQCRIAAGFPSPAEDWVEEKLDLNQLLIQRPAATFFVRVEGDSMLGAGIHPGDLLVVDRSVKATDGKVVLAILDGEFTVKRLRLNPARLVAENRAFPDILIGEDCTFEVWGVVTNVIHAL